MKKNGRILIEVQDEINYILRNELIVASREEMLDLAASRGRRMAAIAAIISRLLGEAPEDILQPNKELLFRGAQIPIYLALRQMRTLMELDNGKEITIARYNRPPAEKSEYTDDDDDGPTEAALESEVDIADALEESGDRSYAEAGSERYSDNAKKYLRGPVIGHIRNRVNEIAACDGIAVASSEADQLIHTINGIVEDLG